MQVTTVAIFGDRWRNCIFLHVFLPFPPLVRLQRKIKLGAFLTLVHCRVGWTNRYQWKAHTKESQSRTLVHLDSMKFHVQIDSSGQLDSCNITAYRMPTCLSTITFWCVSAAVVQVSLVPSLLHRFLAFSWSEQVGKKASQVTSWTGLFLISV